MSARQNKKPRRGRQIPNNIRERTFTTLTEEAHSVSTPREDSRKLSTASTTTTKATTATQHNLNSNHHHPNSPPYVPMNPNFSSPMGYGSFNPNFNPQQQQQQQQQPQFYQQPPQPALPSGQNDLEVLENLKKMIKDGQHEVYRAVPQPAALASLFLGQKSDPQTDGSHDGSNQANPSASAGNSVAPNSSPEYGRRPPRLQKDNWDARRSPVSASPATNNTSPTLARNGNNGVLPNNVGASSSPFKTEPSSSVGIKVEGDTRQVGDPAAHGPLTPGSDAPRSARFDSSSNALASAPIKSELSRGGGSFTDASDSKPPLVDDALSQRPAAREGWSQRDEDDRRRELPDRPLGSGPDVRSGDRLPLPPPARDPRYYDRDRDSDRDRERERDRDWERERDRRDLRPRDDRRIPDVRRPPADQRHYEPSYDRQTVRRYDNRYEYERSTDDRALPPRTVHSDDRLPPPADDRLPPVRAPPPPTADPRGVTRAAPSDSRVPVDNRNNTRVDDRRDDRRPPPATISPAKAADTPTSRPLEERISHAPAPPSLQERLSAPPTTIKATPTPPNPSSRPLEERLGPVSTADSRPPAPRQPPPTSANRDDRGRADDRQRPFGDRYIPGQNAASYPTTRAPSLAREEPRPVNKSPVRGGGGDSYPRGGGNYRPDYAMDADPPSSRYNNDHPHYRPFSPPSAADLARDKERTRRFPPSPPPPPHGYVDERDRRYAPDASSASPFYDGGSARRHEDDRYPSASRSAWDRDNGRYDGRDPAPPLSAPPPPTRGGGGWDVDRDRRVPYVAPARPVSPPPASGRSLGARLTDYRPPPPAPEDRSYPPLRDSRYAGGASPPHYSSRVRPRSPTPPPPLRNAVDRPLKRSRDEAYGSGAYYRDPPPPPGSYTGGRRSPPPASGGGSSYYPPLESTRDYGSSSYNGPAYDTRAARSPPRGGSSYNGGRPYPPPDRRYIPGR